MFVLTILTVTLFISLFHLKEWVLYKGMNSKFQNGQSLTQLLCTIGYTDGFIISIQFPLPLLFISQCDMLSNEQS